ncbi:DUF6371 domain-containing protein [Spirosoma foliorum]|uniref:Uncharacterized protein n=1 Tax=Spirosoma foliorum TaxID=2710596 RepID=A0A7G5GTV6_9BACT|nr:DUF6371 domain-containing protein [Spirosoma foliorum]QMW02298.1 hypothetical protein H3H32_30975 [Spirosoma foliorum]
MPTLINSFRYKLPKKAVKGDCPECGPKHRRTLSRYIDTQTGDPLPDTYGRCDRESNCGYHLSPYHKGTSGLSYHDEQKAVEGIGHIPKDWFRIAGKQKRNGIPRNGFIQCLMQMEGASSEQAEKVAAFIFDKPDRDASPVVEPPQVFCIPEDIYKASLGHYDRNQLARLLKLHLGQETANALLERFLIGTSSRWPGACVFWYIDEQNRKRGGQIKLFGDDFHTAKYKDHQGETRSKTSWVHSALAHRLRENNLPYPEWLTAYMDGQNAVEKSPCLFGLPQLKTAPVEKPIAIVEAPKTAILCSHYFPDFIWMAVGGKSYLNADRLAPLKGRKIALFPDLNAYYDLANEKGQVNKGWLSKAEELRAKGFSLTVSDFLEQRATDEDRAKGLDLADYLLRPIANTRPILTFPNGEKVFGEVLTFEPCETCPDDWLETRENGVSYPTLIPSIRRELYAYALGLLSDNLPLYQFSQS